MPHLTLTNIPKYLNFDDEDSAHEKNGEFAFTPLDARELRNIRTSISYSAVEQAGSHMLGNVEVTFNLGSARHRCLAKKEDKKGQTIIYFLWASDGKHKIMRYHRMKTSAAAPYGFIEKVMEYDFRWKQHSKITGIDLVQDNDSDLLYWTDNIMPRKINIAKASTLNKKLQWSLYVPKTFVFPTNTFVTIQGKDSNGTIIVSVTDFVTGTDNHDALAQVAATVNSSGVVSISAEACACHLKITSNNANVVSIVFTVKRVSDGHFFPTLVVPENWYGLDLIDRMFDQGKYPSPASPLVAFKQDPTKLFNNVKNNVWQFWHYYHYDDFENSVKETPMSLIPIDNIVFNEVLVDRLNYIDVNFNDASLLDPRVLTILKEVSICFRNTNEGVQKEVERIGICDFFDIDDSGNAIARYKFYNNVTPTVIADEDIEHLYDRVPISAAALKYLKNRLIEAGITEGRGNPECTDLKLTPNIADDPTPETHEVTFFVRVLSRMLDDDDADDSQRETVPKPLEWRGPIMHNKGRLNDAGDASELDYPFFGGLHFGTNGANPNDTILTSGMESKYQQNLPEGGWFCYAEGTNYGGISKQVNVGLPTTKDGALIIGEGGTIRQEAVRRIGAYLDDSNNTSPPGFGRDLYSVVKIRVPNGKYIFRLASHWCSFGDKLQKGRMYDLNNGRLCHKTSTNVWGVMIGVGSPLQGTGATWKPVHEIEVTVNGSDVFGGDFVVRDLSGVEQDGFSPLTPITGYLYDAHGSVDEDVVRKEGIPVHRAFFTAQNAGTNAGNSFPERVSCFTDHNGYFYASVTENDDYQLRAWQVNPTLGLANATLIAFCKMTDLGGWPALNIREGSSAFAMPRSLQDLFDAQLQSVPEDLNNGILNQFLLTTTSVDARNNCSTIVRGSFVDQNNVPVKGVEVALAGGGSDISDEEGRFSIVAWGDMIGPFTNMRENNNNRLSTLFFRLPAHVKATYVGGGVFSVTITQLGGNVGVTPPAYSPTAVYDFDVIRGSIAFPFPFVITITTPIIIKARKRRGNYIGGIIYYDDVLRQGTVAVNDNSKVYIPFITEDLSKYDSSLPAGTYRRGPAQIDFQILHANAPKYATRYQLVLVREKTHEDYLTWIINEVKYIVSGEATTLNDVTTFDYKESSFGNNDANMILLDIGNITSFAKKNFDTRIGYTFKKGDKIRLIANETKTGYQGLFEYEIISFQQPSFLVIRNTFSLAEIKPGTLVQMFSPRDLSKEELFFEMGECYPCTAPGTDANGHSVTSGTFKSGDTYWRNRSIPVLNDERNIIAMYDYFMECNSISDTYDSTDEDIGRPQAQDDSVTEIYRPALRRFTDPYIPNTKINGLCRWREKNASELDRQDGLIIDLKGIGDILLCTQEHAIVSTYIEVTEMKNADNSRNLISSKDYFGTDNRLQQNYGAQFADGIAQWDDLVYSPSTQKGIAWRRANNGVFAISDYKARNFWNKYKAMGIWDVAAIVDKGFKEALFTVWEKKMEEVTVQSIAQIPPNLIITLLSPNSIDVEIFDEVDITYFDRVEKIEKTATFTVKGHAINKTNITLAFDNTGEKVNIGDALKIYFRGGANTIFFSEPDNRWVRTTDLTPEAWENIGDEIVAFKDGGLWICDKNPLRMNFFGVQYKSRVKTIYNASKEVKLWLALSIDTTQDNAGNNWSVPVVSNKNGQLSRIEKASFVKLEQYWHSEFYRDLNTQGVADPILNGRYMRNSAIVVDLENDHTGDVLLRSITASYEISERNTK